MANNSIKGFKVGNEVKKYDYNELDNLPENDPDDLAEEISDLKSDLNTAFADVMALDDGELHIPSRFIHGTIAYADGSVITTGYDHRIVTPDMVTINRTIRLLCKSGYSTMIATYNSDGTLNAITSITTNYYDIPANTLFRISVSKSGVSSGVADITEYYLAPYFSSLLDGRIDVLENKTPIFYVGDGEEFETIKAITEHIYNNNIENATVYVLPKTYDIVEEYGSEYLDSIPNGANVGYGPKVGFNTHYIFAEGASVVFEYEGTNPYCADFFSPFNVIGSFIFDFANIKVKNARYCVHDDIAANVSANSIPNQATGIYNYCTMEHEGRTIETTGNHSSYACIGGGCIGNMLTVINGGAYKNDATNWIYPISYHNYYATNPKPSQIIMNNVWMSRGVRLAQYDPTNSHVDVSIVGCYMPKGIQKTTLTDTYFTVTEWNNIIETEDDSNGTEEMIVSVARGNNIQFGGVVKKCSFTGSNLFVNELDYARTTVVELKGEGLYHVSISGGNIRRVAFTNDEYAAGVVLHDYATFSGDSYTFDNVNNYKYLYVQTNINMSVATGVVTVSIENALKTLEHYPLTVLPSYILGNAQYKALGNLSQPYICLSADDGREQLATYTIPMILEKEVPLTMGLWSTSDVLTNETYLAIVQNALANGCEVGQHGETPWTLTGPSGTTYKYDEYKLSQFFDAEASVFASYGITPKSAIYPYGYTDDISRAVAGGRFKVCRSLYTKSYHGAADYSYYCNGARSNIFALSGQNIADEGVNYWKQAIDYAIAHNYLINIFWHDHDLTTEQKAVLEATIDYAKTQNITFIKMSEIPTLI